MALPPTSVPGGLPMATPAVASPSGAAATINPMQGGQTVSGALIQAKPLRVSLEEEREASQTIQAQPLVGSIAAYVRQCWSEARMAKMMTVEVRMLQSMRARRGEYEPDKLAAIQAMGGSQIYAMLTSVKCRAASSWIKDIISGQGEDRPWTISPTPVPDLPPEVHDQIVAAAAAPIKNAMLEGVQLSDSDVETIMEQMKAAATQALKEEALEACDRMAEKMEDQLVQGGFTDALDAFIDDLTTFPSAVIKGPIVRKKPVLAWMQDPANPGSFTPQVTQASVLEWERVSPFNIYPSPAAVSVDDGYLIERHKLSRESLASLIGVEGYDDATIHVCLDQYSRGGLSEWLANDTAIAGAEGKSTVGVAMNSDGLIDAIQFWGSVPGKFLVDWGMDAKSVPDPTKEYHIEAWLIGPYVIKAQLNYDPLNRKPYFKASFEDVPGSWWGNSVADLVRDDQDVVNAAARALVNNMGIASGPQVGINVDRLPPGEDITQLTPWKIWQFNSDPINGNQPPMQFFQPDSRIAELSGIYEKFSEMADEHSGIPKYMAGESTGGAGRTASGLSMMMTNAGKSIKQVISNVDTSVFTKLLQRLYTYNMQYGTDPDLKGDVNIVAHGAQGMLAKEAAQVRRNEFLAATANPIDMQIIGLPGRAAILREVVKTLDMDPDKIVPPPDLLKAKIAQMQMQGMPPGAPGAAPPGPPQGPAPAQLGGKGPSKSGQSLSNGAPVVDNHSPAPNP